jgi:hypothetical protein
MILVLSLRVTQLWRWIDSASTGGHPGLMSDTLQRVAQLTEDIGQLLYGHGPEVQAAVLADLLAMLLAGHIVVGKPRVTRELREGLLAEHLKYVRQLIPVNEEIALARLNEQGRTPCDG